MSKVAIENLKGVCIEILKRYGVSEEDASIIADSIEYAHCRGKHSHGIGRMSIYTRKMQKGLMNHCTPMQVVKDIGAVIVCDADNGFGQVAAIRGADIALKKADCFGVGVVGIRNSNNFGTAGYVGEYVTKHGMICLIFSNSGPAIAPTGGVKALLGTNPMCFAFPSKKGLAPIVFDMACSNVARGKIRLAAKNGGTIPFGWAVDENGKETNDPQAALKGAMIALGGYKGYGLALCVDVLAGLLTGAAFGGDVKNLNHPSEISRYGHLMFVIDPNCFMNEREYTEKILYLIDNLRSCGTVGNILYPGEGSYKLAQQNSINVEIADSLIDQLNKLAEYSEVGKRIKKI